MECPSCGCAVPETPKRQRMGTCSPSCDEHLKNLEIASRPTHCEICSDPIPEARRRRNALFCSPRCASTANRGKNPGDQHDARTTNHAGAASELLVASELLRAGWDVFRSVSPSARVDLLAEKDEGILRVEVTSGFLTPRGKLQHPPKAPMLGCWLAVCVSGSAVRWFKEIEGEWLESPIPG